MMKQYLLGIFTVLIVISAVFPANFASAQYYTGACSYHSYQRCNGNSLYWYDSCGNQQDVAQYCSNGCYNNSCQGYNNYNYNNYNNCTYHAYRLCSGNNIYWYDSCGNQQDLFQSCYGVNMTCQYGQCTYQQPVVPIVYNNYAAHYKKACNNNNIYWYDSLGSMTGLYKNCTDSNACTLDSCASGKCSNVLKCDGTTCATGSADYNTYCSANNTNTGNTNNANNIASSGLSVAFFVKPDQSSAQWQKTASVNSNGKIYFMVSVANNSSVQISKVTVAVNIPAEIASLGNLQINGVSVSGDIVSGIDMGSLSAGNAKSITFEGRTQTITAQANKQAVSTVTIPAGSESDSISISLNPIQSGTKTASASVSSSVSAASTGFWGFVKRWYLWILAALVLVFLFVVVFRRLSSNA